MPAPESASPASSDRQTTRLGSEMTDDMPTEMREQAKRLRANARDLASGDNVLIGDDDVRAGADALGRLADVLDIHQPVTPGIYAPSECWRCSDRSTDPVPWPCETARVARGEASERERP